MLKWAFWGLVGYGAYSIYKKSDLGDCGCGEDYTLEKHPRLPAPKRKRKRKR